MAKAVKKKPMRGCPSRKRPGPLMALCTWEKCRKKNKNRPLMRPILPPYRVEMVELKDDEDNVIRMQRMYIGHCGSCGGDIYRFVPNKGPP